MFVAIRCHGGAVPLLVSLLGVMCTCTPATAQLSTSPYAPVVAAGATQARTAADRAGEQADARDYGADNTGGADATTAMAAAVTRAASAGLVVRVPPGVYTLNSNVTSPAGLLWQMEGTTFTGSGQITQAADWSAMQQPVNQAWISSVSATGKSFNTFNGYTVLTTGASANYEKDASYINTVTFDPSTYSVSGSVDGGISTWTSLVTKDAVGIHATGAIGAADMTGRAWGMNAVAYTPSTADGLLVGLEVDSMNNATIDQPYIDQPTTKTGLALWGMGSTASTAAVIVGGNYAGAWHDGFVVKQRAVSGYAFRIIADGHITQNAAAITPAGDATFNSVTAGTSTDTAVLSGSASGPITLAAGGGTNVGVVIAPAGTGAFTLTAQPGTLAFGARAVDLQTLRGQPNTQVASGTGSLAVGANNLASASYAMALGTNNSADGANSVVLGNNGAARGQAGRLAWSSGGFSTFGDAQWGLFVLRASTTNGSATRMTADGLTAGSTNTINLPNNGAFEMSCKMIARASATGHSVVFTLDSALVTRGANAAATVTTGAWVAGPNPNSDAVTAAFSADTTNGGPNISVTAPGSGWHAVARCETTEVQ